MEAIINKIIDLVKTGKVREVSDVRNEIGLEGLKITIDLKRGVDPDRLMARLYSLSPLEDSFSCNFNILIGGVPRVMGVGEILQEWTAFRVGCVRRRVFHGLKKAKDKLHLLRGLAKILMDIDKAISIVRHTEEEAEVVPNLMIGFGIDELQAEYVAEIRLRHLNREYILRRTDEISRLETDIADMEDILASKSRVNDIIIGELRDTAAKYGKPRKSTLLFADELAVEQVTAEEEIPDYPCTLFFTAEGYFKKITPQSLRMSNTHKLKDGDSIARTVECSNRAELLFFSDKGNVYKSRAADFADTKASAMGDYVASRLGFDEGESAVYMAVTGDYSGYMLFFFENGKAAKVDMSAYETKTNRRKLVGAYSDKSPLIALFHIQEEREFMLYSSGGRILLAHTGAISAKTTRSTQGVQVMVLKGRHVLERAAEFEEGLVANANRYRTKTLPAAGATRAAEDSFEQLTIDN